MLPEQEGDMIRASTAPRSIFRESSSRFQVQMPPRLEGLGERGSVGPERKRAVLSAAEVGLESSPVL